MANRKACYGSNKAFAADMKKMVNNPLLRLLDLLLQSLCIVVCVHQKFFESSRFIAVCINKYCLFLIGY